MEHNSVHQFFILFSFLVYFSYFVVVLVRKLMLNGCISYRSYVDDYCSVCTPYTAKQAGCCCCRLACENSRWSVSDWCPSGVKTRPPARPRSYHHLPLNLASTRSWSPCRRARRRPACPAWVRDGGRSTLDGAHLQNFLPTVAWATCTRSYPLFTDSQRLLSNQNQTHLG